MGDDDADGGSLSASGSGGGGGEGEGVGMGAGVLTETGLEPAFDLDFLLDDEEEDAGVGDLESL